MTKKVNAVAGGPGFLGFVSVWTVAVNNFPRTVLCNTIPMPPKALPPGGTKYAAAGAAPPKPGPKKARFMSCFYVTKHSWKGK